ncbi:TetR/AcrR family transcriptional regulator [Allokutzneria albata]|uniref:DNA-binding transcriptional regulator, AcrR family n=1 Tax=Allokutzneria albata TaxID=211114 RepID=A0A1G9SD11_ALLAB|nr:TetR/AcrR family transcriptional regulator [Allokutzneria albata]SDM33329.1 DNA-binding transcriptional regulator, AcrR family [Allokutzneria albata]
MAGRPRDPDLERRLLAAAWSLLTSQGYDTLTLTQVATRAKAHRTDVYRRWSSKARLVTDALAEHLPPVSEVDTGSLRTDLRAFVDDLAASWSSPWIDGLVGLLADLRHDADADIAFRTMAERRGQPLVNAITRAVRRGEIRAAPDLFLAGDLLEGPLMHRRLFGRQPLTPDYLDAVAQSAHRMLTGTGVAT